MKGSSIAVRIADFLKEYPPFSFLETGILRELARQSKVTFHEDGEIVFSKGQPRDRWLYVIQKGNLQVVDEKDSGEHLVDLRGPGDILGLQGIRSEEPYLHTCKTDTETILYGLPRDAFVSAAGKVAKARRYLAAYFSLNPAYQWGQGSRDTEGGIPEKTHVTLMRGGLLEVIQPQVHARKELVAIPPDTPVREAARLLQSKRVECVLVIDEKRRPIGKLTDADLRDRILDGSIHSGSQARDLMFTDLVAAGPDENTGQLLLKLTRHGKHFLVVTEDGSLQSPVLGLLSERDLFLRYGRFPTLLGEAISSAPDIAALRRLRDRLEALILEFLETRDSLRWLMDMTGVLNRKMSQRILELSEEQMRGEGWGSPPCRFSWLMMGSGGRDELLIRSALYHALIYDDPGPGERETSQRYFRELARRSAAALRQCGFMESPQNVLAQKADWCLPLSRMKERFSRMIADPVGQHVYSARDAFDFQPLGEEPCPLAEELSRHIEERLVQHPGFIRHMAMDSLMNQPPRTIFKGYVVDREGIRRKELAIKFHALLPLVDVARVLSLQSGRRKPTQTFHRLQACALNGPGDSRETLFNEASEAFLMALYARISEGLRNGTDGAVIQPGNLDAQERTLLKTAFRTILRLLEVTSDHFELDWNG